MFNIMLILNLEIMTQIQIYIVIKLPFTFMAAARLLSSLKTIEEHHVQPQKSTINCIQILQIIFYIIFIIKIINISFFKVNKLTVKQRIFRKYRFSYKEIIEHFNEEDQLLMVNTLNNTLKNVQVEYQNINKDNKKKNKKKVTFCQKTNQYYEHLKKNSATNWDDDEEDCTYEQAEDDGEEIQDEESRLYVCEICTENSPKLNSMVQQLAMMNIQAHRLQNNRVNSLIDHYSLQQLQSFSQDDSLQELQQNKHQFSNNFIAPEDSQTDIMSDDLINI